MSELPLDRKVAASAARWFLLIASGEASARELQACQAWRQADAQHERAWQRAQQVSRTAGLVPGRIGQAVLLRPAPASLDRRAALKTLMLLMTAGPAGWVAVHTAPWRRWSADYATGTGEQKTVLLPDGTEVVLNTATAVDIAFNETDRRLLLRQGEIMVSTAPDPLAGDGRAPRPFCVATAEGTLTPVGTRFIVRQLEQRSLIAVLEGAVALRPRDRGPMHLLKAGHAASFTRNHISPEQAAPATAGIWARGIVAADNMRLDQLLAELGRYRHGVLDCDPAIGGLRVSGGFQIKDIDGALTNIADLLTLDIRYRTRFWVTLLPPAKK